MNPHTARFWLGLVVVLLTPIAAAAADYQIQWTQGPSYPDLAILVGDTVTFTFSSSHNVYEFPDQQAFNACNFTLSDEIGSSGPLTVPFPEAGTRFFGCEVGSHCSSGNMKIQVIARPVAIFADGLEDGSLDGWSQAAR